MARSNGLLLALLASALTGCATTETASATPEMQMFDSHALDALQFLEGRWVGTGPDGKPFYEAYRRVDDDTLVSERYEDETFGKIVDGSTVSLDEGEITSRWGDFTWRADEIRSGFASFAPINAPSAFTWRRIDDDTVEVTQRWRDESNEEQRYSLELKRID